MGEQQPEQKSTIRPQVATAWHREDFPLSALQSIEISWLCQTTGTKNMGVNVNGGPVGGSFGGHQNLVLTQVMSTNLFRVKLMEICESSF